MVMQLKLLKLPGLSVCAVIISALLVGGALLAVKLSVKPTLGSVATGQVLILKKWRLPLTLAHELAFVPPPLYLKAASIGLVVDKNDLDVLCQYGANIEITIVLDSKAKQRLHDHAEFILFAAGDPSEWSQAYDIVPGAVVLVPPGSYPHDGLTTNGESVRVRVNCNYPPKVGITHGPEVGIAVWSSDALK